jgi:hypothetical protein
MAQLYLPVEHDEADLVLAGLIADCMASDALYVTWTAGQGSATPALPAALRPPAEPRGSALRCALRDLWAALRNRPAAGATTRRAAGGGQRERAA